MTILVTGATGNVGPHVVTQLKEAGASVRAFVLTGDPKAADLPDAVEIVEGDLAEPDTIDPALEGVEAVLLMWPFFTLNVDTAPAVIQKIAKQASRVVFVSSIGVHLGLERVDNNCHAYIEELLEDTNVGWTFLQVTGFYCNAVMSWAAQIRADGVVRSPHGAASRSSVHEGDVAAVAVRALLEDTHAGAKYVLTGPENMTLAGQVKIIGEAIGRPATWQDVPAEVARQGMIDDGWPPSYADGALDYFARLTREPEKVTTTVADILGRPARTFRDWITERADAFA